jgi:hypothetical protein
MGYATLSCFLRDSTEGLRRIPGTKTYDNYNIWLLTHPDLRDAARFRSFRKFIVEVFDQRPLLTGKKPNS